MFSCRHAHWCTKGSLLLEILWQLSRDGRREESRWTCWFLSCRKWWLSYRFSWKSWRVWQWSRKGWTLIFWRRCCDGRLKHSWCFPACCISCWWEVLLKSEKYSSLRRSCCRLLSLNLLIFYRGGFSVWKECECSDVLAKIPVNFTAKTWLLHYWTLHYQREACLWCAR